MRHSFFVLICSILISGCAQEPKNPFDMDSEALSTKAELVTTNWNGYGDFVFELKDLTENFTKDYAIEKTRILLSKSQAILYSMPSELRNETTQDRASDLVDATKELYNSMTSKSEEEIKEGLKKIVSAYTALNKEINYYTEN